MFGILITALGKEDNEVNKVINRLKSHGYEEQDISLITKIKEKLTFERKSDLALPQTPRVLESMLSQAQIYPNLGGLLITGPVTAAMNFLSKNRDFPQSSLFSLLVSIGIPKEDAFYFTEIVEDDGFLLVLPEFGDLAVYDILWTSGADRILILEDETPINYGFV